MAPNIQNIFKATVTNTFFLNLLKKLQKTFAAIGRYGRYTCDFNNQNDNGLQSLSPITDSAVIKKPVKRGRRKPLKASLDCTFKRKPDRLDGFLPTYDFDDPYLVKNSQSFNLFYIQEEQIFKRLKLLGDEDRKKVKKSLYALKK